MTRTQLIVEGMTCQHCVHAVTTEVSALPTVSDVAVQLVAGGPSTVTVTSTSELSDEQLRAAIEEAGYSLVEVGRGEVHPA